MMKVEWTTIETIHGVRISQTVEGYHVQATRRDGSDDLYLIHATRSDVTTIAREVAPSIVDGIVGIILRTVECVA